MVISEHPASEYAVIGTRPIRHDGLDKVTGRAVYGADIRLSELAQGAVLRSPYPHARIVSIDTSRAEAAPGVLAVMTGADVPGTGPDADRVMAGAKVVYRGHPVAAVAATSLNLAQEAVDLIDVEYEKLQPILGIQEAMSPDSEIIHPDYRGDHLGESVGNTNVSTHLRYVAGDAEKGFGESEVVVEREVELATVHQGYIEPHSGTARWDENGRVTVWTSTQGIFGVRDSVAKILGLPQSGVVVEPLEIGGGFGGKLSIYLEPLAAILSKKCGKPVKMYMDRKSVFEATGPAAAAIVKIKMGVDGNGRIRAAQADLRYDAGAYPGSPVQAGAVCCFAAYDIPNVLIDGYAVMTTKPRTSAYRAPGSTHVAYGVEVVGRRNLRRDRHGPAGVQVAQRLARGWPTGRRADVGADWHEASARNCARLGSLELACWNIRQRQAARARGCHWLLAQRGPPFERRTWPSTTTVLWR